jgi:hypothetical protein
MLKFLASATRGSLTALCASEWRIHVVDPCIFHTNSSSAGIKFHSQPPGRSTRALSRRFSKLSRRLSRRERSAPGWRAGGRRPIPGRRSPRSGGLPCGLPGGSALHSRRESFLPAGEPRGEKHSRQATRRVHRPSHLATLAAWRAAHRVPRRERTPSRRETWRERNCLAEARMQVEVPALNLLLN